MQIIRLSRRDKISITTGAASGYTIKYGTTLKGLNISEANISEANISEANIAKRISAKQISIVYQRSEYQCNWFNVADLPSFSLPVSLMLLPV